MWCSVPSMEDGLPDVPTLTLHKNLCLLLNLYLSKFALDVKLFWHTLQVNIFLREFSQLLVCARSGLAHDIYYVTIILLCCAVLYNRALSHQ